MFEAQLAQGGVLKKLMHVLKDYVDYHRVSSFDCSADGLGLQALDISHISLVSVMLRSEGFNYYRCDRPVSLGVNVDDLAKVLEGTNDEDIADDQGDTATFLLESAEEARVSKFELKLSPVNSERLAIPDTPYTATVRMPSSTFQDICRNLWSISEFMKISLTKGTVEFSASSGKPSDNITIRQSTSSDKPEDSTEIDVQEPFAMAFRLEYLANFVKATPLSPMVTLCLHQDLPMVVKYCISGIGHISFYLAPYLGGTY